MWQYDDDEGIWQDEETGYSYNPIEDQFELNENDIDMEDVPLENRRNLEDIAWDKIFQIIGSGADPINQGDAVQFTDEFGQGNPIETVQLNGQVIFGSQGATPCLIIFSIGWSPDQGAFFAKGAHRDNAFNLGEEFLREMTGPDESDWEDVKLYVVGGEVGSHT